MNSKPGRVPAELETLDQLLGGPMCLGIIRSLFDGEEHFVRALTAMLHTGEVRLIADGQDVPHHRWRSVLRYSDDQIRAEQIRLDITKAGAARVT